MEVSYAKGGNLVAIQFVFAAFSSRIFSEFTTAKPEVLSHVTGWNASSFQSKINLRIKNEKKQDEKV